MKLDPQIQNDLVQIAAAMPEVSKLILFGSRARGDADERSDIDIAVEASGLSREKWLRLLDEVEEVNTLLPIDVIRFEEAAEALKENIVREGKILYARSENRAKSEEPGQRSRPAERSC